jgi:hypothetical protein
MNAGATSRSAYTRRLAYGSGFPLSGPRQTSRSPALSATAFDALLCLRSSATTGSSGRAAWAAA